MGLLQKNIRGHVKTTVMYAKCIRTDNKAVAKRTEPYAKRDNSVVKTHTKNNTRTTLETVDKNSKGYRIAQEARQRLTKGLSLWLKSQSVAWVTANY